MKKFFTIQCIITTMYIVTRKRCSCCKIHSNKSLKPQNTTDDYLLITLTQVGIFKEKYSSQLLNQYSQRSSTAKHNIKAYLLRTKAREYGSNSNAGKFLSLSGTNRRYTVAVLLFYTICVMVL